MNKQIFIGIDPDVHKSGVALLNKFENKPELALLSLRFFELYDFLTSLVKTQHRPSVLVRIDAGWLNHKSNHHHRPGQTKNAGERIAKNVGSNHEVGRKIAEMCEYLGIDYELVRPAKSKVRPEYFKTLTGIETKNQELIDAGMLVHGF